jgi:hypothetical protein
LVHRANYDTNICVLGAGVALGVSWQRILTPLMHALNGYRCNIAITNPAIHELSGVNFVLDSMHPVYAQDRLRPIVHHADSSPRDAGAAEFSRWIYRDGEYFVLWEWGCPGVARRSAQRGTQYTSPHHGRRNRCLPATRYLSHVAIWAQVMDRHTPVAP